MHEHLKEHPEEAFMLFTKVYIYSNNTNKKWSQLIQQDKDSKDFKWSVIKLLFLSKNPLTELDIKEYWKNSPELDDPPDSTNTKAVDGTAKWKKKTEDYIIYNYFPVTAYDVKLILNILGIRMTHFIEN